MESNYYWLHVQKKEIKTQRGCVTCPSIKKLTDQGRWSQVSKVCPLKWYPAFCIFPSFSSRPQYSVAICFRGVWISVAFLVSVFGRSGLVWMRLMDWHRYEVHGTHVCPLVGRWCELGNLHLPQKEQDWLRWTVDFGRPSRAPLESKLPPVSSSLAWGLWTIFLMAQSLKNLPAIQETWVRPLGREDPPERGMMTHFSVLAWRIAWTEEPGGYSGWGHKESDTPERLTLSLSRGLQTVAKLVSMSSFPILSDRLRIQDSFPNTDYCCFLPLNSIKKCNLLFSCIYHLSISIIIFYSLSIYHLSFISVSLYLFSISIYLFIYHFIRYDSKDVPEIPSDLQNLFKDSFTEAELTSNKLHSKCTIW